MRRPTPAGQGSVGDCPLPLVRALSEIVPSRWSGLCRRLSPPVGQGSVGDCPLPLVRALSERRGHRFGDSKLPFAAATLVGMQLSSRQRKWLVVLAPAVIVLCVSLFRKDRGIDIDEVYWVGSTYYYHLLAHERDVNHPDWQLLPARENPPIGRYLMGLYLNLFGRCIGTPDLMASFYLNFDPEKGHWGSGPAYDKRHAVAMRATAETAAAMKENGRLPADRSAIRIVRTMVVLCAMCCAVIIGLIGCRCGSRPAGLLAGSICAVHPVMVHAYGLALIDMIALLFACLTVLLYMSAFDERRGVRRRFDWRSVLLALGIGGSLACACGAKMNSLVVAAVGVCLGVWAVAGQAHRRRVAHREAAIVLAGGGILSFVFFVVPNPTLYPAFFNGLVALFREHALTAGIQETFVRGALHTIPTRLAFLGQTLVASPLIMAAVAGMAGFQAWCCLNDMPEGRARQGLAIVVCWWWVAFVLLLAWVPFAWGRYALPLLPATCLIVGKTCDDLVRYARARWGTAPDSEPLS